MNTGRIIKNISNLYTVEINGELFDCHARGKFRNEGLTPLVGDIVTIDKDNLYILSINERKNELTRPCVTNIDKCIIVVTCKKPDFQSYLLDKMLVNVMLNNIEPIICFTKFDLCNLSEQKNIIEYKDYYNKIGIPAFINNELTEIYKLIDNKTVALTGQTGAGKSTLINKIEPSLELKTNEISEALGRGKHTTRHVELFALKKEKYSFFIMDTPGFSALDIVSDQKENIKFMFPEFNNEGCKFRDCKHIHEKNCAVIDQYNSNEIMQSRYENYVKLVNE